MDGSWRAQERGQPAPARVVVADDHDIVRAGLRGLLAGERDLLVVGEARTGRQALELCLSLQPDLVMLDIRMPDMDGLAATEAIKRAQPATRVVIITMHESADYLFRALRAGADGYLLKGASHNEVVTVVRRALRGEAILDARLAAQLLQQLVVEPGGRADPLAVPLTPREHEVLQLLAQGLTNRQIGGALTLGAGTVKTHVEHILAKLGVEDRTQAAVRGIGLGLVGVGVGVEVGVTAGPDPSPGQA